MKYYEARDKIENLKIMADKYNKVANRLFELSESDYFINHDMDYDDWEKFPKQMYNATKNILKKYLDKYEGKAHEAEQECARLYNFEIKEEVKE